jgi:hypothetical protein
MEMIWPESGLFEAGAVSGSLGEPLQGLKLGG